MKNSQNLFKLAAKFQRKYAQSQTLQEIITNASSYGNDIMNFIPKLKELKGWLGLRVVISSGLLGKSVKVAAPATDPAGIAGAFAPLTEQVKKYLDRNLSGFPQLAEGTYDLSWDFREPANEGGGIAQNPNW